MDKKLALDRYGLISGIIWIIFTLPTYWGLYKGFQPANFYESYLFGRGLNSPLVRALDSSFFLVMLLGTFGVYFHLLKQANILHERQILRWTGIFCLVLIPMFPFTCQDLFYYIAQGHLAAHYGVNPYLIAVKDIPHWQQDQILSTACWNFLPNVYGPAWITLSRLLTAWAGPGLTVNFLFYKTAIGLLHLLNTWLIGKTAGKLKVSATRAMLAYGWNPLLLFELVGNGHNDAPCLTFMILSIYTLTVYRGLLALPALTIAALFKYTPTLLLPLWLIHLWQVSGELWPIILPAGSLLSAALIKLFFWPYWQGPATLAGLKQQFNYSIKSLHSIISSLTGHYLEERISSVLNIVYGITFIIVIKSYWKQLTQKTVLLKAGTILFIAYLFIANKWYQQWYLAWILPLALLLPEKEKWHKLTLNLSFFAEISRLPQMWTHSVTLPVQLATFLIAWVPLSSLFINKIFIKHR